MPQEPKRRHSKQRQGKRRASINFTLPNLIMCPNCKNMMFSHRICPFCGFYNGRQVVTLKEKKLKQDANSS